MKESVKVFGRNIVAGFGFSIGAMLIFGTLIAWAMFMEVNNDVPFDEKYIYIDNPGLFTILEHEQVPNKEFLTVKGKVFNNSDTLWDNVSIDIIVLADTVKIGEIKYRIDDFSEQSERNFYAVSYQVAGIGLPDNITYKVEISDVYTLRENL